MNSKSNSHARRSIRLPEYDYSQPGAYFVTICTYQHVHLFGNVFIGEMQLNEYGEIVLEEWLKTANLRDSVSLGEWIIMPNHFHGIIYLSTDSRGKARCAPTTKGGQFGKPDAGSLSTIMRSFKAAVTKRIHELNSASSEPIWQRNYYEHIIRNEDDLRMISDYIATNPLN
jgi:putative transposase